MTQFEQIREKTQTIEGMARMFISHDWNGAGHTFSEHATRWFDTEQEAIEAEIKYLNQEIVE